MWNAISLVQDLKSWRVFIFEDDNYYTMFVFILLFIQNYIIMDNG